MSSATGHAQPERPERSRNAKAQARHRAKRKAYIEQLEQTVTKLQIQLGYTPEFIAALPPPAHKIKELMAENERLQDELDKIKRIAADSGIRLPLDLGHRRGSLTGYDSRHMCDRDYKRRKMSGEIDDVYINSPDASGDPLARPPPLTIPQPLTTHYNNVQQGSHHHHHSHHSTNNSNSLYNLHAPAFQMPNTPSGSSSTSSPPFSPAQMQQTSSHSSVNNRSNVSNHHVITNYAQQTNHYGSVKVEDENYVVSSRACLMPLSSSTGNLPRGLSSSSLIQPSTHHNSHSTHAGQYSLPSYAATTENGMENWHTYSSERALTR